MVAAVEESDRMTLSVLPKINVLMNLNNHSNIKLPCLMSWRMDVQILDMDPPAQ